jgi:hypothetical protein
MADKKEKLTLVEVAKSPSLFRKRQAGDTLHFGENEEISVSVESLTHIQFKQVQAAENEGEAAMFYELLRHGIKNITGLTDEDGNPVAFRTQRARIGGRDYLVCSDDLIDGLNGVAHEYIAAEIINLTTKTFEDAERLGFTKQSAANAQSDAPEASDPVCSAEGSDGTGPQAA